MKISIESLTQGEVERLKSKGYDIVVDADSGYADVHKPVHSMNGPENAQEAL